MQKLLNRTNHNESFKSASVACLCDWIKCFLWCRTWVFNIIYRWIFRFQYSKCRLYCRQFYLTAQSVDSFRFEILLEYTGCPRRYGQNFGRVFLMLNYTDITQNTYIQSWTVPEIMAIEKCGLLGCPRTVRRLWCHTHPLRMPGNETLLANIVMQWPWRDNGTAAACVNYLET